MDQIPVPRNVPFNTARMLRSAGGIAALAEYEPLTLLMLLADIVPEVSQAIFNIVTLICNPKASSLKAVDEDDTGKEEDNGADTQVVKKLFCNQPAEAGDYWEQLAENVHMVVFGGMAATEGVLQ